MHISQVSNNKIVINGIEYKTPKNTKGNSVSIINETVFVNGYQLINGKWKRTLRAIWHLFF